MVNSAPMVVMPSMDFDKLQMQLQEEQKKTNQQMQQLQTFTITPLPDDME